MAVIFFYVKTEPTLYFVRIIKKKHDINEAHNFSANEEYYYNSNLHNHRIMLFIYRSNHCGC